MARFGDCNHNQCRECLVRMVHVHLKSGTVDDLRCHTCGVSINPALVRSVVGPEASELYDKRLLSRALDRMTDGVYCPRCSITCIREDDNMAACFGCGHVFCTECFKGWHPGSSCLTLEPPASPHLNHPKDKTCEPSSSQEAAEET